MTDYTEKSTQELIELLIKEEDRVTLEHIQELAARPDAIEPLRGILRNDSSWRGENSASGGVSITLSQSSAPRATLNCCRTSSTR